MKSNRQDVFTLLVDNEFGVLTRITALIRRAGWNIRSLAVAQTAVLEISRLTVCLECRHHTVEHVLERLSKLNCVRQVTLFSPGAQVARELCLVRVGDTAAADRLTGDWGGSVIGESGGEAVVSVCGEPGEIDAILEQCRSSIRDVARTGTIAIKLSEKGEN